MRIWLRHLIAITDDIELVGEAADAAKAVELAHSRMWTREDLYERVRAK